MARDIADQRCFNHGRREAAARCPECRRYFCRECVTEHEDRVVCASCLGRMTETSTRRATGITAGVGLIQALFGLFVLWLFFLAVGKGLLQTPSSFHEGAVWQRDYWDVE